ncbi:MAG: methyltransferase [Oceanicoccus sp.]
MIDHPFQLLARKINEADNSLRALWVVDENIGAAEIAAVNPGDYLQVITNRCDVYLILKAAGFSVELSDYDFASVPASSLDVIYYRVSKEKAVVHYIINAASRCLRQGGELVLAGYKNDGIKTYLTKATALLGELGEKQRGSKTATMAALLRRETDGELLDDKGYRSLTTLAFEGVDFVTKPGIFGWNKIDQGSQLLVDQLADEIALMRSPPQTIVDLGCGYGFISVMASRIVNAEFIASDNNMAAINACTENFRQQGVSGSVVVDDCAAGIQLEAELVLCNPPFHQGFDIEDQLTEKFLLASTRLLAGNGVALFVVNRFIPLERKATKLFKQVETIADNGRFKVVRLSNV